jgi:arylsulfatase A-like enzyme
VNQRDRHDELRLDQYRVLYGWDRELGRILQALEDAALLEDTVFLFISDNGYLWGEHRLSGKNKPYDAAVRVPLAIACGAAVGCDPSVGVTGRLASNIDLAPTITSFAQLPMPADVAVDGMDLTQRSTRRLIVLEHYVGGGVPSYCGVRSRRDVFIRYETGEEEYYNYRKDPWEEVNRAGRPATLDRVRTLRTRAKTRCDPPPRGFEW